MPPAALLLSPSLAALPQQRWRLRPGQHLLHRQWDDEFVVFNNLSGDCHLLDEAGFAVLGILQPAGAAGLTLAALAAALAEQFDDVYAQSLHEVEPVLAGLKACELIEACR